MRGHTARKWKRAFAAMVEIEEIAAFAIEVGEWTRNGVDAAGDAAVPARHADTRMRKATRFVTRNEGERYQRRGTAGSEAQD